MKRRITPQGRARLRRALESPRRNEYQGSTESRPTEGNKFIVLMHTKSETRLFINRPRCESPIRGPDRRVGKLAMRRKAAKLQLPERGVYAASTLEFP